MALNDYEKRLIDQIAEYGWFCLTVAGGEEGEPQFSYTIGLWETLGTPELIVFGLESKLSYWMLADMIDRLKAGERLVDGARISGLLVDHDCVARAVHPSQIRVKYLNSAIWYRRFRTGDEAVEAFQLFWPGVPDGLFPWESGCDAVVREKQPLLFLPDEQGIA